MQHQLSLVDRSCPKRGNEEYSGLCAKRQRRVKRPLETAAKYEDVPQIRGGLARPRPPPLGPPPNRATRPATRANTTNAPGATVTPSKAPKSGTRIVEDEEYAEDYVEPWRLRLNKQTSTVAVQPTTTTGPQIQGPTGPPKQLPKVGNATTPLPSEHGSTHLPTPPKTDPSNKQQGGVPGTGTGPRGSSMATTATTSTAGTAQAYSTEQEILDLFERLQKMIFIWVDECLPDTVLLEFQTEKPERYWELCGWTKPMSLGASLLQNRSLAKYVYESWVWRFLHQEIFHLDSLAWAGGDVAGEYGGLGGLGKTTNSRFDFIRNKEQQKPSAEEYQIRTQNRAAMMQQVHNGLVRQDRKDLTTGWIVEEMLVAFHPYFAEEYKPIERADNIEVLIRDTRFLILKAQELDYKLRSAEHVYDMILGSEGDVCRISATPSPKMEGYHGPSRTRVLRDDDSIALIVVPGLVRCSILDNVFVSPLVSKHMVRYAKAFTQLDFRKELEKA